MRPPCWNNVRVVKYSCLCPINLVGDEFHGNDVFIKLIVQFAERNILLSGIVNRRIKEHSIKQKFVRGVPVLPRIHQSYVKYNCVYSKFIFLIFATHFYVRNVQSHIYYNTLLLTYPALIIHD